MTKKLLSLFLALLLLCNLSLFASAAEEGEEPVQRKTLTISSLEEFLAFAENCRLDTFSQDMDVVLASDIDLLDIDFEGIPSFSGTFDGKGHTISSLAITKDGSIQGLFRYLTECAVVKNLTVGAAIQPAGSRDKIGTIAGSNEGLVQNCSVQAEISGNNMVGGIVGFNAVSGTVEGCRIRGVIQGTHFIGGIAGQNNGVIRNCKNHAAINTTAQQNEVDLSDVTLASLTNSEQATTVTDVGGIAGISSGVIRSCQNKGDVGYQHMGYNIGGIAGTQSGYLVDCENTGHIQGRKEVGGIVGQMEPVSYVEYQKDTLQILQDQLKSMSGTVNQTVANVQNAGDTVSLYAGELRGHVENATASLELLIPSADNPTLPDMDTIQAARNGISSSMYGMQQSVQSMSDSLGGAVDRLSGNLNKLQGQLNAMYDTLGRASDNLGGSIQDVSDLDTQADLNGKVENCRNHGKVLADRNVGGIVGAMAVENDLDAYSDFEITGESSLNFESEVRCVVLNCVNQGPVTVKKSCGGGIVGNQTLGLVKQGENTGLVRGENAQYVGGISGQSNGFIRACAAKCTLSGKRYAGGIAGTAAVATDCYAVVEITDAKENVGAILGDREDALQDIEAPFSDNFYLVMDRDMGGMDGISYDTQAQPLSQAAFFALETLPKLLKNSTVTFRFADGSESRITVAAGDDLAPSKIPPLPEKAGFTSYWEGLDEAKRSNILFDMTFDAVYVSHSRVIQSDLTGENHLPLVLAEGDFFPDAQIAVEALSDAPTLGEDDQLLSAWEIQVSGFEKLTHLRLQIPQGCDRDRLTLYGWAPDGRWIEVESSVDGSYLVFAPGGSRVQVALAQRAAGSWYWYALGISAVALAAILVLKKRGSKKR